MKQLAAIIALSLVAIAPVAGVTDPWDLVAGDDDAGTDNELVPGVVQQHDLQAVGGVADQDWYRVSIKGYSSYEVVVDGLGETVATVPANSLDDALRLEIVTSAGGVITTSSGISTIGSSRHVRLLNTGPTEYVDNYIRVRSAVNGCGTTCTSNAIYRISMHETTMFAPRFNNSGSQITVLMLQNTTGNSFPFSARFYSVGGTLLASVTGSLPAHGGTVINTAAVPALVGTSGVISVDHSGTYGGLAGKSVALEPATGFSFDTPLVPKPQ
jgi:hypothetical protein